jgi:hypothetical protein
VLTRVLAGIMSRSPCMGVDADARAVAGAATVVEMPSPGGALPKNSPGRDHLFFSIQVSPGSKNAPHCEHEDLAYNRHGLQCPARWSYMSGTQIGERFRAKLLWHARCYYIKQCMNKPRGYGPRKSTLSFSENFDRSKRLIDVSQ